MALEEVRQFISHQLIRLLESLPSQFLLDPQMVPAVRITNNYSGPGIVQVRIRDRKLKVSTVTNQSENSSVEIDLRNHTLGDLPSISTISGVNFTLLKDGQKRSEFKALNLLEIHSDVENFIDIAIHTNPLWVLLRPFAWTLGAANINYDVGLNQLNVLESKDFFADYWGRYLGVPRRKNEDDGTYTRRIIDTLIRPRENNFALENILISDLDLTGTISDLLPRVLQANLGGGDDRAPLLTGNENESFIAGNVYNSGNFFVDVPVTILTTASTDALKRVINENKAAGTRAFFREQFEQAIADTDIGFEIETPDFSLFDVSVFDISGEGLLDEESATVEICDVDNSGNKTCCYYVIDTGGPIWIVGQTPMPGSRIVGGQVPFEYEVVCDPPDPPLGFNIVPLTTQTVAEGWELTVIQLTTQTVDEDWEQTQQVNEEWGLNILESNTTVIDEMWDLNISSSDTVIDPPGTEDWET